MSVTVKTNHGVKRAKRAYVNGEISLGVLEQALDDRLGASSYKHDRRIDPTIPPAARGDDHTEESYRDH